jgi:hypothetical protein
MERVSGGEAEAERKGRQQSRERRSHFAFRLTQQEPHFPHHMAKNFTQRIIHTYNQFTAMHRSLLLACVIDLEQWERELERTVLVWAVLDKSPVFSLSPGNRITETV